MSGWFHRKQVACILEFLDYRFPEVWLELRGGMYLRGGE